MELNLILVPDPTQRRRPKGDTETDPWPPLLDDNEGDKRVAVKPAIPELAERANVTRTPLPSARQPISANPSMRLPTEASKSSKAKPYPFLQSG